MSTPHLRIVNKNINLRKGTTVSWELLCNEEPLDAKSPHGGFITLGEDGRIAFPLGIPEGEVTLTWAGDLRLFAPGRLEWRSQFTIPSTAGAFEGDGPDILLQEGANLFQ